MTNRKLPDGALEVMLKEYDTLRQEIQERLKVAFSHFAYAGAIAAFALPVAEKLATAVAGASPGMNLLVFSIEVALALFAFALLIWVALLNMSWVQHCGFYIESIESDVNAHFGGADVLGWERYGKQVMAKHFFAIPKPPLRVPGHHYPTAREQIARVRDDEAKASVATAE